MDGDVYNIIPLNKCPGFASLKTCPPAAYEQATRKLVDHPSTMADVAQFVMEYINSDVCAYSISLTLCLSLVTGHRDYWDKLADPGGPESRWNLQPRLRRTSALAQ